jgi:ketosteroid isomerase-like protein
VIRNIEAWIRKLEAEIGTLLRPVDRIVVGGNSEEECEAKRRAVIADGEAADDDMFIFLVPPKPMNGR